MKVLILGSQHGNERLGIELYEYIKRHRPALQKYIVYKLANPRAFKQNVRYSETDMNRSYATNFHSYEASRASQIVQYIDNNTFDLVLDMHTTTCDQPPCLIIDAIRPENSRFIMASTIAHIVEMQHPIVKNSLNTMRPHVISIEVNKHIAMPLLDNLCDDIERYCKNIVIDIERYSYQADQLLEKDEISGTDAGSLVNFQLSSFGFYPVLVGENSYKQQTHYLGFKAYGRRAFKV